MAPSPLPPFSPLLSAVHFPLFRFAVGFAYANRPRPTYAHAYAYAQVKLPPAVVGKHDSVRAVLSRELDVFPRADALDDDRQAGREALDPRDVFPGQVGIVSRRGRGGDRAIQGRAGRCLGFSDLSYQVRGGAGAGCCGT